MMKITSDPISITIPPTNHRSFTKLHGPALLGALMQKKRMSKTKQEI